MGIKKLVLGMIGFILGSVIVVNVVSVEFSFE